MVRSPQFRAGAVPDANVGFGWESLQRLLDYGNFGDEQAGVRGVTSPVLRAGRTSATGNVIRADVRAVEGGLAAGGMFSINSLDDVDPWVRARAEALEDEVLLPVNANCHVSLMGESALGVHADPHDVYALQTAGSKRWAIFGNGPEPGEQTHEFVTESGDELFLPRGWWHFVRTVSPSIHLTVGVTWPTAARLAPQIQADDELWSQPLVPEMPADQRAQIEQGLAEALDRPADGLIEQLIEDLRIRTPWRPRSDLLAGLEPWQAVRLRRPRWCRRRDVDASVLLEGSAVSVALPAPAGPLVDALLDGQTVDAEAARSLTGGVVDAERFAQVVVALWDARLIERVNRAA